MSNHGQGHEQPVFPALFVLATVLVLVGAGVLLVVFNLLADDVDSESWASFWRGLSVLSGVIAGSAFVVLTIEYFAISHVVTPVREDTKSLTEELRALSTNVREVVDLVRGERESGQTRHYTNRKQAVAEIYEAIRDARKRAFFLGICNDIFEQLSNNPEINEPDPQGQFHSALLSALKQGCEVEFLYLDRREESKDLYLARQEAEGGQRPTTLDECQLLQHTRVSLNYHTLPLYFDAVEENVQDRLRIKEYHLAPTLSVIVVDDRLFVAPYIAQRCTEVPVQEYTLKQRASDSKVPPDSLAYLTNYDTYASKDHSRLITPPEPLDGDEKKMLSNKRQSADLQMRGWTPDRIGPYEQIIAEPTEQRVDEGGLPLEE